MPAYRVRVNLAGLPGMPGLSTFYLDAATITSAQAAHDVVAAFLSDMDANQWSGYTWSTEPEVTTFASPDLATGIQAVTAATGTGGVSGEPLPLATQLGVTWRTDTLQGNRRIQGRTFFPAYVENQNDSGQPSAFLRAGVQDVVDEFVSVSGLTIASRVANVFAPVVQASVQSQWAVLRSRRP